MTSDRLKNLAKIRLILSVIAVLLAGLMVVSGVMLFRPQETPAAEEPTGSAVETTAVASTEATEIPQTEGTAIDTEEETTETITESTEEAYEENIPQAASVERGSPDYGSQKDPSPSKKHDKPKKPSKPSEDTSEKPSAGSPEKPSGDTSENPSGGTPEKPSGGTSETPSGGAPENPSGGTSENPSGGAPEKPSGSTSEKPTPPPAEPPAPAPEEPAVSNALRSVLSTADSSSQEASLETAEDTDIEKNIVASQPEQQEAYNIWALLFWGSAALLALDLLTILLISRQIEQEKKRLKRIRKRLADTDAHAQNSGQLLSVKQKPSIAKSIQTVVATQMIDTATQVGTIHQMGRREYQQDSLGHAAVLNGKGILAVVADGMGGLSGGEKVSQKIVMDALTLGHQLKPGQVNGVLWRILDTINENVNRALGPEGLYKSGSTMVAVLAYDGKFQWIAVGDSRIYLYRQGYANQLNHDHDQLQVWMADVLSGRRSMEEILCNPDGRKLTSFIGMGQLKYVDGSRTPITLEPGDRLVLMSDGIYNIVTENRLAEILKHYPDVEQAASVIDRVIRDSNHPHQDNYTAIVLGF